MPSLMINTKRTPYHQSLGSGRGHRCGFRLALLTPLLKGYVVFFPLEHPKLFHERFQSLSVICTKRDIFRLFIAAHQQLKCFELQPVRVQPDTEEKSTSKRQEHWNKWSKKHKSVPHRTTPHTMSKSL